MEKTKTSSTHGDLYHNSYFIFLSQILGMFPFKGPNFKFCPWRLTYTVILTCLSLFQLACTYFYVKVGPESFGTNRVWPVIVASSFLSSIACLSCRYTCLFITPRYVKKINSNLLKIRPHLQTTSYLKSRWIWRRKILAYQFVGCMVFVTLSTAFDLWRTYNFIQSPIKTYNIYFYCFKKFQKWTILCADFHYIFTVLELVLAFSQLNECLVKVAESFSSMHVEAMLYKEDRMKVVEFEENLMDHYTEKKRILLEDGDRHFLGVGRDSIPMSGSRGRIQSELKRSDGTTSKNHPLESNPEILPSRMSDEIHKLYLVYVQLGKIKTWVNSQFQLQLFCSLSHLLCVGFLIIYYHFSRESRMLIFFIRSVYINLYIVVVRFIIVARVSDNTRIQVSQKLAVKII